MRVVDTRDCEGVCEQTGLCAVDVFKSRVWEGNEEAGSGRGFRDEGGGVVVGCVGGGERGRDGAEHLHCRLGFVEVGEGCSRGSIRRGRRLRACRVSGL